MIPILFKRDEQGRRKTEPSSNSVGEGSNSDHGRIPDLKEVPRCNLGDAPAVDGFLGRTEEQATLKQWIIKDRCRLVAILGMRGIGKTSLALKLAREIQDEFEYVKWLNLENAQPVTEILKNVIMFFSNQKELSLPNSIDDQISRLIYYLKEYRCLLILDNVEPIFKGGNQVGQYRYGYEEYGQLFQKVGEIEHKSCLLLTSREEPHNLERLAGETRPIRFLPPLAGLSCLEGQKIFTATGKFSGSDKEWKELIDLYEGNPLILELAAKHIEKAFGGNISSFLINGKLIFKDLEDFLNWYFEKFSDEEREIVYWLAINRESVLLVELKEDILSPQAKEQIADTIQSLRRLLPLEQQDDRITLQPALKEYIIDQLVEAVCSEIKMGEFSLFNTHALLKVEAADYVRKIQIRLILESLIKQLEDSGIDVKEKLTEILKSLPRSQRKPKSSYAAGNLFNLFVCLKTDLTGYDFSQLTIWQADLRNVSLHRVNFSYSDLSKSAFSEPFYIPFSVAFDSDGELLATGHTDGEICLWEFKNRVQRLRWKGHEGWIHSIAFSPKRPILATGAGGSAEQTLRLWDAQTGDLLKSFKASLKEVHSVAFSPDGKILANGREDAKVKLWDVETYKLLKTLKEHTSWVETVVFSSDGHTLASGSWDKKVKLWDVKTGVCCKTLEHDDRVAAVAFSPDGTILASGSYDRAVKLWHVETGECFKTWVGHDKEIWAITFSPSNGKILATGSVDNKVRLWDAETDQCLHTLEHDRWVHSVAFNHDGGIFVSGSYEPSVKLWDVHTGQCLESLPGYVNCVHSVGFSSDGKIIASCSEDQIVRLWNI